jgi:hypothetical protein
VQASGQHLGTCRNRDLVADAVVAGRNVGNILKED